MGIGALTGIGRITEADAFFWQVVWEEPMNINDMVIGGVYPNQPQPNTRWKVQLRQQGVWTTLSEGTGGWINKGIFTWGGPGHDALVTDGVRVLAYSDGTQDLVSIHLRGRGGQSVSNDDRSMPAKATQFRYLPADPTPLPEPPAGDPVKVIFETDMHWDCDDAGALAMLHTLADRGECELLAVIVNSTYPEGSLAVSAINTYYGRPDIPVGSRPDVAGRNPNFPSVIAAEYPRALASHEDAHDAVTLYRQILSAHPDESVVVISVGWLTNLQRLLDSPADGYSPLNGADLVARKVAFLSCMGGRWPEGREYNFYLDASATDRVISGWRTPIMFSGGEIGGSIQSGRTLAATPMANPVRRSFEVFHNEEVGETRHSWDQTSVLYAVRGLGEWWTAQTKGSASFNQSNERNNWLSTPDHTGRRDQGYLVEKMAPAQVGAVIDALMTQAPRQGRVRGPRARILPREGFAHRVVGGHFQGSADGHTWTDLGRVDEQPDEDGWTSIPLSSVDFPMLRYLAPDGSHGNLAGLEFRVAHGARVSGYGMASDGDPGPVLDEDPQTFFQASHADGAWVGLSTVPTRTLRYEAGPGGAIQGPDQQLVPDGGDGVAVTAIPEHGAAFDSWSDGHGHAERMEMTLGQDLDVSARFRSAGGVPIDWYAEHHLSPGTEETWADLDTRENATKNMTLRDEYVADTNPHAADSVFRAQSVTLGPTLHVATTPRSLRRLYTLQVRNSLVDGEDWTPVDGQARVSGDNQPMLWTVKDDDSRLFFRVVVEAP